MDIRCKHTVTIAGYVVKEAVLLPSRAQSRSSSRLIAIWYSLFSDVSLYPLRIAKSGKPDFCLSKKKA